MKLKTSWTYNYKKGLKDPMVSNDYYMEDDKIYFTLSLGLRSFDSVLLELNPIVILFMMIKIYMVENLTGVYSV